MSANSKSTSRISPPQDIHNPFNLLYLWRAPLASLKVDFYDFFFNLKIVSHDWLPCIWPNHVIALKKQARNRHRLSQMLQQIDEMFFLHSGRELF